MRQSTARDGKGGRRPTGRWEIRYYSRDAGKHMWESGFATEAAAERALRQRLSDQDAGKAVGPALERTTLKSLARLIRDDYAVNRRRSAPRVDQAIKHLTEGLPTLVKSIRSARLAAYTRARLDAGAKPATINRELSCLKRMLSIGREAGVVGDAPRIHLLREDNTRRGFFEPAAFEAVLAQLPERLRPVVQVAYITGWRVPSEILTRQWRHVDFAGGWLRLEPGETKNRRGRMFPLDPELRPILASLRERTEALERKRGRVIPWVFHRESGARVASFRKRWRAACVAAGQPGRLLHDFRRTAVRNLERAGVPRSSAMEMIGHVTESIYRRYAIVDEGMLREGADKLARNRPPQRPPSERNR